MWGKKSRKRKLVFFVLKKKELSLVPKGGEKPLWVSSRRDPPTQVIGG